VNKLRFISSWALATAFAASTCAASAQQSFYERFRADNASMAEVQPSWIGPLSQSDPRLGQALRFSVSNAKAPGAQIVSYGNNHGISVIADRRFQLEFDPPAYFRNHSAALKDGFGNAGAQVKWRIASGNAQHGNFIVTAILSHDFSPRSYQNGLLTGAYTPTLAAGRAFKRFDVQSTLGGLLPTGKIPAQGRLIAWNTTAQVHASAHTWFNVENNTAFYMGGPFDGKKQNFIGPAAYYMVRRKDWKPSHATVVFDCAMQIATTSYHQYNHNLITEMRVFF
jgi:hypothetical protein